MYTDASEAQHASVVTQNIGDHLSKPVEQQQHEPLAFLGGECTGAWKNQTTYEKRSLCHCLDFQRTGPSLMGCKADTRMHLQQKLALRICTADSQAKFSPACTLHCSQMSNNLIQIPVPHQSYRRCQQPVSGHPSKMVKRTQDDQCQARIDRSILPGHCA